jgi:hypothetical protein
MQLQINIYGYQPPYHYFYTLMHEHKRFHLAIGLALKKKYALNALKSINNKGIPVQLLLLDIHWQFPVFILLCT